MNLWVRRCTLSSPNEVSQGKRHQVVMLDMYLSIEVGPDPADDKEVLHLIHTQVDPRESKMMIIN